MSQLNFFSKIDSSKRAFVVDFLKKSGTDLFIKIRDQNYRSKILQKKNENQYVIYKFASEAFKNQNATFSFEAPEGRFFFKGSIASEGPDLVLSIPNEIYQLDRRNDFRIDLPPKNEYPCAIISIKGKKQAVPIQAELRNISLGGCQVWIQTSDLTLKKNDEISLSLTIKNFEWENIKGITKQIRPANEKGDMTVVGMQFKEPSADFLTEVQSALMYLDRIHRQRHDKV